MSHLVTHFSQQCSYTSHQIRFAVQPGSTQRSSYGKSGVNQQVIREIAQQLLTGENIFRLRLVNGIEPLCRVRHKRAALAVTVNKSDRQIPKHLHKNILLMRQQHQAVIRFSRKQRLQHLLTVSIDPCVGGLLHSDTEAIAQAFYRRNQQRITAIRCGLSQGNQNVGLALRLLQQQVFTQGKQTFLHDVAVKIAQPGPAVLLHYPDSREAGL